MPDTVLELVPLPLSGSLPKTEEPCDVSLIRLPSKRDQHQPPVGQPPHHAVKLYTETVALVVEADHELANDRSISVDELAVVSLLDYPGHLPSWPAPTPWSDAAHKPANIHAALELVSTGIGALLLPQPLARHLTHKTEHAVLTVTGEISGTEIWATWLKDRDTPEVQQLIGVLRGRTAQSSRLRRAEATEKDDGPRAKGEQADTPSSRSAKSAQMKSPQKSPPKNSRGAQLAAARSAKKRRKR